MTVRQPRIVGAKRRENGGSGVRTQKVMAVEGSRTDPELRKPPGGLNVKYNRSNENGERKKSRCHKGPEGVRQGGRGLKEQKNLMKSKKALEKGKVRCSKCKWEGETMSKRKKKGTEHSFIKARGQDCDPNSRKALKSGSPEEFCRFWGGRPVRG